MEKKRLSKRLAAAGVGSRRACEEMIFNGLVTVNGHVVLVPQTLVGDTDHIVVEGKKIGKEEGKVYYLLNKPYGFLCSNRASSETSRLVIDLFTDVKKRLFTVGRLDKNTTGLLIVTNDGHFANQVIHPSFNVKKEYLAKTDKEITDQHLKIISRGIVLEGIMIKPQLVKKIRRGTLKIVVSEGKRHEVRHLLAAAGLEAIELKRIRVGGLHLGNLPEGAWRVLTERERKAIFQ